MAVSPVSRRATRPTKVEIAASLEYNNAGSHQTWVVFIFGTPRLSYSTWCSTQYSEQKSGLDQIHEIVRQNHGDPTTEAHGAVTFNTKASGFFLIVVVGGTVV